MQVPLSALARGLLNQSSRTYQPEDVVGPLRLSQIGGGYKPPSPKFSSPEFLKKCLKRHLNSV